MKNKKSDGLIGGVVLIGIGLVALLTQFVDFVSWQNVGIYLLLLLGLVFYAWGIVSREAGVMIPGGILSGIGLGVIAMMSGLLPAGVNEAGVFMVVFGFGWASITLLTAVFTDETQWWALIPGGIIAFVGVALLFGGVFMNILEGFSSLWPLILIIVGLSVIWKARKAKEKSPEDLEY